MAVAEGAAGNHDHARRGGHADAASARPVAEHLDWILGQLPILEPVRVPLEHALGLALAEDVTSATDTPPFDNSAMDGYAVGRADLLAATPMSPVVLPVVADLAAGTAQNPRIDAGQVARIMTGAPIPDGADAVVPIEDTDRGIDRVGILRVPEPAAHIRRAGSDAAAGDTILRAGTTLWPTRIAAAASAGRAELLVHPAPRVAVISTGDELIVPGTPARRGQIPDSNSYLLAAAVAQAGGVVHRIGAVPDNEESLRTVLDSLIGTVDAIILSGGVSVGAYDVVKAVLAPLGVWFGPVRMQPGKPQGFGRLPAAGTGSNSTTGKTGSAGSAALGPIVFALPGNPVSAFVSFEAFVRPALLFMGGHGTTTRPTITGTVARGWSSPSGRQQYMPVVCERRGQETLVWPATSGGSGSHLVAGLGQAEGLAIVPEESDTVAEGDLLPVMLVI
ncbi:molybdopterin molybdotransferase MoeA [Cryobacterium sp. 10S3]|uniref:molybdopterin molybdotransferase MoeA n=1 Tax=unclassified Cryobacterium TaxID=2649013 RepID=UPI002AC94B04|nr:MULTISPECIES: gephyrin-like molybdotransferase Glp [unclassified Cryobacterium]MEB0202954.1 molybdopterin molybdotransferase MoeA [Cryobacterium sp. 5I3]MEB0286457.1 molybdopterin molybdotransferase MoeA [Cryobacterium sp. 10S3]WPX14869.1 molybdopterin molybdotransferase MoeA [Cryobacterium sp. 10S3]